MKRLFLASALFLLILVFAPKEIFAQGTCTCLGSQGGSCYVNEDNCEDDYYPQCQTNVSFGSIRSCSPVQPDSCFCVEVPEAERDPDCGAQGQRCCAGETCDGSLICFSDPRTGSMCITQEQVDRLPGRPPQPSTGISTDITCDGGTGINTAIGCIPFGDPSELIGFFLRWAIGIGGGIAFLLILFACFQIMTSTGNPERLKAGQELLTSAIAGLILLIFSVFILKLIGVDILQLPDFRSSPTPVG